MTKEDFDAEVYEYAKSRNGTEDSRMTDRMSAYRAGAESREKQITVLSERCTQLQKDKGALIDKVSELERKLEKETAQRIYNFNKAIEWKEKHRVLKKENTELKEENKVLTQNLEDTEILNKTLVNRNAELKELLKQWLQTSKASGCDNINIVTEAEQFLNSEVEKYGI